MIIYNFIDKSIECTKYSDIPCRICSQNSSGTHFGLITCEACKVSNFLIKL